MSQVSPLGILVFNQPVDLAGDLIGYRLFYRDLALGTPGDLTYSDEQVDVTLDQVTEVPDEPGKVQLDLASIDFAGGGVPADGQVLFGVCAEDDAGNLGDISNGVAVPFDLEAPEAITGLEYRPAS